MSLFAAAQKSTLSSQMRQSIFRNCFLRQVVLQIIKRQIKAMKQKVLLLLLILVNACLANAQSVSGNVKDAEGKNVTNATVSLLNKKDSSIAKLAVSGKDGNYSFQSVKPATYIIKVSFVGYATTLSHLIEVAGASEVKVPVITLKEVSSKELKGVEITSKKPMIEVKADKTILNVEGSINAVGQDMMELLRKSPGVIVDKDDNIIMSGKNGVQVYIDGKPSPLAGKDLTDYLRTIQSSQVEAVELITNPSAKYDAAGNAGIINIRLKKNKSFGTNGSATAGYNIGIYPKYNGGISLNHRNKKVNVFGNYNYNRATSQNVFNLYRELLDTTFDQNTTIVFKNKSHGFKTGVDFFVNKNNTIGIMVNGSIADLNITNEGRTPITYKPTGVVNRILVAPNNTDLNRSNVNFNINYRHTDTAGRELNMDADYGFFRIKSDQFQPNFYYNPTSTTILSQVTYNMLAPTDIDIYTFKTDYEQNFKKGRLGIGGKISFVNSDNDFRRFNVYTGSKVLDTLRSNRFRYTENINALYINYNRSFKGLALQLGLRSEYTSSNGQSTGYRWAGAYTVYDTSFKRSYIDLFPSAAITFNKNPKSIWSITYSRRIDRPSYQNLNPFEFKLDEYTSQKGNTQLRPQYTNSFGITNIYKSKLTTTLNYSHVNDIFTQLLDTAERSKTFVTQKNLATADIISLNISLPVQHKWYGALFNVNSNYSHNRANFGSGRTIDLDAFTVSIFTQQTFKLGKGFTGEVSGLYNSPFIAQGTFKGLSFWNLDAGLQKTLFKGRGNLKISVSDIFHTQQFRGSQTFVGQYTYFHFTPETRLLKTSFVYRFGSNQVKGARQRKSGLEDENKRVGSQGGGIGNN